MNNSDPSSSIVGHDDLAPKNQDLFASDTSGDTAHRNSVAFQQQCNALERANR